MPKNKSRSEKSGQSDENRDPKEMSLSGHLKELRNRLLICAILLVAAMLLGIRFAPALVRLLLDLGERYHYEFVYLAPQELLLQYFSIAFLFAVCVTLPMILYQLWAFISPGLREMENLFFFLAMVFGLICFFVGVGFAYRVMLPFMLRFLIELSNGSGVSASISVQNYLTFLLTMFLIFGAVFELPVLAVLLTQLGLVKVDWMKKFRKAVIILIFFIAAVITPPDVVSQVMVAIPMLILYEFSIWLSIFLMKFREKSEKES